MSYFYKFSIILTLLVTSFSYADKSIVISQVQLKYSVHQLTATRILKAAYSRIGQSIEFEKSPAARTLTNANSGVTDGDLARMEGIEKKFPNLIRIPVSITSTEAVVYSKNHNFKVEGWESLKPYKIGFMSGFQLAQKKTAGMDTETVTTEKQGLEKLNKGRSDVFIGLRGARCLIKKLNLNEITSLDQPLAKANLYHYLHKRHSAMAARLEEVLTQMKDSGEIKLIQEQSERDFLSQCE